MSLSKQNIENLIALMQKTYPGWANFSDPSYIKDEVEYKRNAIAEAYEILSESELKRLLDEGNFDEILARFKKIGRSTNLLWDWMPSSGDLAILEDRRLDKQAFCREIIQLLYGPSESQDRLDKFQAFIETNGLPNKWTFPTFFLFVCHPDTEMLVKPKATKLFFEYLGIEDINFSRSPTGKTYAAIKQLSHQLKDELKEYRPNDMVDIQSFIFVCYNKMKNTVITPQKREEFLNLFKEFVQSYLLTANGRSHSSYYEIGRKEASKNFEDIKVAVSRGEDVTDQALLKLMPYSDSGSNKEKGFWISIAPAFSADVRIKFGHAGWRNDGWTEVANQIFNFVSLCHQDPDQLSKACTEFSASPYSKGFQAGTLTPILNALRPDKFLLINKKSRLTLNYFTEKSYTQNLIDYPKVNSIGLSLIEELSDDLQTISGSNNLAGDLFDIFSHWLVAIKKYPPLWRNESYWKIAPGENGKFWDDCHEGGFIAIEWIEIGDISRLDRSQFNTRRDQILKEHSDWTKNGVEQVWKFAHIKEGDRIIANKGTTEVLGIGTVIGPYFFVKDAPYGHRLPVEWEDVVPRQINEDGWRRTLIPLDRKKFEEIITIKSKKSPKNIWWVNQGESIRSERKEGILSAPKKTDSTRFIPHWERLVEISPEDIILHYANGKLRYVSIAIASAFTANRPFGKFNEAHLVKVDYYDLSPPIPLARFSEELQKLAIKDGPLNITGGVKEGYLWRLNPEALKIIQTSQPETKWPEFAILGSTSTWIFQANPNIFDIDGAISELKEMTWKVNRYRERIHAGDTVYLWKSGENAGIVAVGKILSEPALLNDLETEKRFIRLKAVEVNSDAQFAGVRISIEHVLESTVRRQDLLNDPLLRSMQILLHPQGTNFVLNDEEAKAIYDLINPSKPKNPEYTLEQCVKETGLDELTLKRWKRAIERKGQAIIYGPPGTGKTFIAEHLAEHLIGGGYGFKETVQFHSAYVYEDFIQGIRPKNRDDGKLEYHLVPGRFLKFCQEASGRQGTCVLIIDEINRANLARVFGELMYLLEYREKGIPLASDGNIFSIPENVRIIGTMNTADRSIALVDHALRRRFAFLRLQPEYGILRLYHEREKTEFPIEKLIQVLRELNEEIGDPHYEIGISYFIKKDLSTQIEDIWTMEIEPYLEEHFFNDADKIKTYRWANIRETLNL